MNKRTKSELIKLMLIVVPLISFITFMFIGLSQREKQLKSDPIFTYGIIVDTYIGAKGLEYFKYRFVVDRTIYIGHQGYYSRQEHIKIGDTCEIVYVRSDPDNSEVLKNSDKTLKIRRAPRK